MIKKKGGPIGRHSIGVVSRRTGLKPDVIRAWERRYGAIEPKRTETNRRYYSDEEVERLLLLRQATLSGRQIGQISDLSTEELRDLVATDQEAIARAPRTAAKTRPRIPSGDGESHLAACLNAVENLDSQELQYHLEKAGIDLSQQKLLDEVILPLLEQVGDLWEEGELRVAHEHLATSVISSFLAGLQTHFIASDNAPPIIIGTPFRQFHEMGALVAAATAASEGWRVTYLGPNLPAEELAVAVQHKGAAVVSISVVYPGDDPLLEKELIRLRRLLGRDVTLLVGGRSASGYGETLERISAVQVADMSQFRSQLRTLRSR